MSINKYKAVTQEIFDITGYSLPEEPPPVGKEVAISLPNKEAYKNDQKAVCVYFGNGEVLIYSKETKEEYLFNGKTQAKSAEYKKRASVIRRNEQKELAKLLYFDAAKDINPEHAVLSRLNTSVLTNDGSRLGCHVDYAPEDINFGELREAKGSLLQAFWSFDNNRGNADGIKFSSVRFHDVTGCRDYVSQEYIEPCLHIHQFIFGSPVVWTCGLENALRIKQDCPSFTVVEAFNLEHLKGYLDRSVFEGNTELCGLSEEQSAAFELLVNSDTNHSIQHLTYKPSRTLFIIDEMKGVGDESHT